MSMSTVGILVYLDGSRAFRSWDGDMVRALVCFSVDGRLVRVATGHAPPAATASTPGAAVGSGPVGAGSAVAAALASVPPPLQHQQQQPVVFGPPPPPPPFPLQPLPANAVTGSCASAVGGAPPEAVTLPSSSLTATEEIAPWELAAASAAAAAAAGAGAGGSGHGGHLGGGARGVTTGTGACPGVVADGSAVGGRRAAAVPMSPGASAALGLALPKDRDLFPTVTIHSSNTEVRLCFVYSFVVARV